jgi:hypothetical protein
MKIRIFTTACFCFLLSISLTNAQSFERSARPDRMRPVTIKEQILMKLDSIDLIYFSRLKTRDKFEARRRLDNIAQLADRMEDQLKERERTLIDRERIVFEKEKEIQRVEREREKQLDREHDFDHNRDKDRNRGKENDRISPISVIEFSQLTESIDGNAFDQDKKKIVRTSSMSNYFLIDQVIKIVAKFSFDKDKLEVIQILYPRILDLDKNYLLYNCFTFSDSKNKLEQFIEENSQRK